MIIPMKKVTVLCMSSEKSNSLEELRELGLMHVDAEKVDSVELSEILLEKARTEEAINLLSSQKGDYSKKFENLSGGDISGLVAQTKDEISDLVKILSDLQKDYDKLSPWGEFNQSSISDLKEKGIFVYLCVGADKDLEGLSDSATVQIINEAEDKKYFVVISQEEISDLPIATVPTDLTLKELERDINNISNELKSKETKMLDLKIGQDKLIGYLERVEAKQEFIENKNGMIETDNISYLQGFVGVDELEIIRAKATESGWGILIEEPSKDDEVPTKLKIPKIFQISKPIFDFIGIAPGYKEWDISICFLAFFTIFFGMIVGDAGYGALFFLLGLGMKFKFAGNENAKLPINLFLVLSVATIIWGMLGGNYFGVLAKDLPESLNFLKGATNPLQKLPSWVIGIEAYSSLKPDEIMSKNVQYLCFLIAAIHLSFARIWKTCLYMKNITSALGQLGWGLLIWGNFFLSVNLIVYNESFPDFAMYLYIAGFALTVLFSINWKEVGDILNFPFGIIGSFVDVLSYIRLFAVGLSTYYIADSFNDMGMMLLDGKDGFSILIVATVLIILFGHVLNIILAFMGVLVHGIRLNTLEFSNHMELEWTGTVFKPFKKNKNK